MRAATEILNYFFTNGPESAPTELAGEVVDPGYVALIFVGALAVAGAAPQPDIAKIVQDSARVTDADRQASAAFDYSETDKQPDGSTKTWSVRMVLGSPYRILTAVNGTPLDKAQRARQQDKLKQETARRRKESASARQRRVTAFQKEQERDRHFITEFVGAFNYKLTGEQELNGRKVYVVDATPRPGFQPTDHETQVMTGMEGELWIDEQTHHWVRVQAEVTHPVSIEGFLAAVQPGTRFELDRAPVTSGIWEPTHYTMAADAKVLSVFNKRDHADETYFDYHLPGKDGHPAEGPGAR